MRTLSNTIFLLIVALFGFGFLLAYSFNLTKDLTEAREQLTRMQAEMQSLQIQYDAIISEKNGLTEQVSTLTSENIALQTQVKNLEAERQALTDQMQTLQVRLNLVEKTNPFLAWLVSTSKEHITTALLVVPIVPLSLAVMYIMVYPKAINPYIPADGHGQGSTVIHTALTREEFHLIARYRRSQAVGAHILGRHDTLRS